MIHYSLRCEHGDEFDAWFRNSTDYDEQNAKHLVECPHCGSTKIEKAPMAPNVHRVEIPGFARNTGRHQRVSAGASGAWCVLLQ